jgi:hypothetical protein
VGSHQVFNGHSFRIRLSLIVCVIGVAWSVFWSVDPANISSSLPDLLVPTLMILFGVTSLALLMAAIAKGNALTEGALVALVVGNVLVLRGLALIPHDADYWIIVPAALVYMVLAYLFFAYT